MCRRNLLYGVAVLAFGLGLLVGLHINSGFLINCIGWGLIGFGFSLMRKK